MHKLVISTTIVLFSFGAAHAQGLSNREFSVNGFRNPSVGLEYRHHHVSAHAGYYPTAFESGKTTNFLKAGLTVWFLPVGKKEIPSSFYAGASYLYGFNRDYRKRSAAGMEAGFRWSIWKGLNFRIGAIAVAAPDRSFKINPAPGISYSFLIK